LLCWLVLGGLGTVLAVINPGSTRGDAYWPVVGSLLALVSLVGIVRELRNPGSTVHAHSFTLLGPPDRVAEPVGPFGFGWRAVALVVATLIAVNVVIAYVR
jgi:hypothetical protein